MRKIYRISSLFLVLVVILICVSGAAAPVHAIVLDPVSFLYPIWQAYGMANGITVTTIGGDQFTQQGFNGLFDEWQQSEVAQGVQSAVQGLADFVSAISGAVSVTPGQVSGPGLLTRLRLGADLVGKLARFWNWIIVDKLGGTSVDSTDFVQGTGNAFELSGFWPGQPIAGNGNDNVYPYQVTNRGTNEYFTGFLEDGQNYFFFAFNTSTYVWCSDVPNTGKFSYNGGRYSCTYNSSYGFYVGSYRLSSYLQRNQFLCPVYDTVEQGLEAIQGVYGSPSVEGSISVAPEIGVDVLGFPDTTQPDYTPADTNINWNIPYDESADTTDYLDDAYQKSLDNDLQLEDQISDSPVTGSGEVGSVGEYVTPGLAEVFPFCIPFDIYRFFTLLVAEPLAPSWTAQLAFPDALGGTQSVTIDLNSDTWNNLAAIVRTMELLVFIIGLAYVTRSMFIRG